MSHPADFRSHNSRGGFNSVPKTPKPPSAASQGAFFAGASDFNIHGGLFQHNAGASETNITYDNTKTEFNNQGDIYNGPIHANNFQGQHTHNYRASSPMEPPGYYDLHEDYPRSFDHRSPHASGSRSGANNPAGRVPAANTSSRPNASSPAAEFSGDARPCKSAHTSSRSPLSRAEAQASPALSARKFVTGIVYLDQDEIEICPLHFRQDEDIVILADHLQVLGNLGLRTTDSLQRYLPGKGFWSDVGWKDPIIVVEDDCVTLKRKGLHVQM